MIIYHHPVNVFVEMMRFVVSLAAQVVDLVRARVALGEEAVAQRFGRRGPRAGLVPQAEAEAARKGRMANKQKHR